MNPITLVTSCIGTVAVISGKSYDRYQDYENEAWWFKKIIQGNQVSYTFSNGYKYLKGFSNVIATTIDYIRLRCMIRLIPKITSIIATWGLTTIGILPTALIWGTVNFAALSIENIIFMEKPLWREFPLQCLYGLCYALGGNVIYAEIAQDIASQVYDYFSQKLKLERIRFKNDKNSENNTRISKPHFRVISDVLNGRYF